MTDITERASSGSRGLDEILRGGLPRDRLYLLEGAPGSGKTTLALQFLLDGLAHGERCLYITLSETTDELRAVAASHGWTLDKLDIFELSSADEVLGDGREQSVLHSWEVELGGTIRLIQAQVDRVKPSRVVFDSLTELRLMAEDSLRFRRQVLALKQFFAPRKATVLLIDATTRGESHTDSNLHSLSHGVITLERLTLDFGAARRRLQVQKLRGVDFVAGYHDFSLRTGGLDVFPRLIAATHHAPFLGECVPSGIPALDEMLRGGPKRGTSTLLTGPAGSGKTTLALQYVAAACARGEACTVFEFDERVGTLLARSAALGIELPEHIDSGLLSIRQIGAAELSPGEFAWQVRREVEERECRLLVIDSLTGYIAAMPQEQQLILQMHELLSYLNRRGVVTFLIMPQHGLVGTMATGALNISYVADTVVLLRFFEAGGRIRKAISVIKNRGGSHEDSIRELRSNLGGLRIGPSLVEFKGVLTGTPEYVGPSSPLLEDRDLDA